MLRRDFLVGSAAGATVLALPNLALGFSPNETYQESIRRRARSANEVLLCWGQRSGKSFVGSRILADRLLAAGALGRPLDLAVIGSHSDSGRHLLDATWSHVLQERPDAKDFDSDLGYTCRNFSVRLLMDDEVTDRDEDGNPQKWDVIVFDELDWVRKGTDVTSILEAARLRADLVLAWSTPERRHGGFLDVVLARQGLPGVLADHAATWEVNPLVSKASTLHHRSYNQEVWERDFAVYKE